MSVGCLVGGNDLFDVAGLTMAAAEQDHSAHDFIRGRYQAFRTLTESALVALQVRGELPGDANSIAAATLIAAAFDGLQTQWMYDQTIDVRAHMAYLLLALGIDSVKPNEVAQLAESVPGPTL